MFKKAQRMTAALFRAFVAEHKEHTKHFVVTYRKSDVAPVNKYAVIVSKKISTSAVVRNKIKRRVLSVLKDLKTNESDVVEVVVRVKNGADELDISTIKDELSCTQLFHSL